MFVDISRDVRSLQILFASLLIQPLHFAIQTVPHQFQRDIRVAKDTRRLPLSSQKIKDLVDIGHVEVATQAEVLGPPIVTPQEGVNVLQSFFPRGRIAQMPHVELASKGLVDTFENLRYRILTFRPFTKHIFLAHGSIQIDTCRASAFLTTVMLLLHHQIELIQRITPRAVFMLIIR